MCRNLTSSPTRGCVQSDLFALRNIHKRWTMLIPNWSGALNQFAILFEGQVPMIGFGANSLSQNQI
jgi:hypothetical protein